MTRRGAVTLGGVTASLLVAAPAQAHGLAGRADLPIPTWLFGWAAALVLILSFAALATLWPRPRLQEVHRQRLLTVPRWVEPLCGAIGVGLFALVIYSGLAGTTTATENFAPTFIYVIFWVGLVPASILLGDVFRAFNPWRAIARAMAWCARLARRDMPPALPYPAWLGRWPAVVGIVAFAWLELAYSQRADPPHLALFSLGYACVQLVGMALYGIERWTDRGDGFSVYFNLFSRLAPLGRRGRELCRRAPLSGVTGLHTVPGTIALLCVMIGSTSYDGLESTTLWSSLSPKLERDFTKAGLGRTAAAEVVASYGLAMMILLVALVYRLGIRGMRTVPGSRPVAELRRQFVHTLTPIAVAYVLAHYFSFLVFNGQAIWSQASDPLGHGANLFGTAGAQIDYGIISGADIWYVQVAALVAGHVAALVLAHDRALVLYPKMRDAIRSQGWVLVVMVGFTSLGLWLLASINA